VDKKTCAVIGGAIALGVGLKMIGAYHNTMDYSYAVDGPTVLVRATGNIGFNEGNSFDDWRSKQPNGLLHVGHIQLVLDSEGGIINGGRTLAAWVRDNQVDTYVPNGAKCLSACTMIWGAGRNKFAGETAQIGVHAARDGAGAQASDGTAIMAKVIASEGAPAAVVKALTSTNSYSMHILTREEEAAWSAVIVDRNGHEVASN
jgi:hypothetical protein